MFSYLQRREKQLDDQKQIDDKLKDVCRTCPAQLSQYLLYEREVNRQQMGRLKSCSYWNYFDVVSQNMDEVDAIHSSLKSVLSQSDPSKVCSQLSQLTSTKATNQNQN